MITGKLSKGIWTGYIGAVSVNNRDREILWSEMNGMVMYCVVELEYDYICISKYVIQSLFF